MKKEVSFLFVFVFLFFSMSLISAANETDDLGYQCLDEKIGDCSSLSLEENIFSLLSTKQCYDEVIEDSMNDGECWPDGNCDLKTTSQTVLALKNSGKNTDDAREWLISQNSTTDELRWFLQIESPHSMECTISYPRDSGDPLTTNIAFDSDRKISELGGGNCIEGSLGAYWPEIRSDCFDKTFTTICNESFSTSLLYKLDEPGEPYYVSSQTHSAAASGQTEETLKSQCFEKNGACNYEGTLWATYVLDYLGEDITPFLPYLITLRGENENRFPSAFLWHLTGDDLFYNEVISKQTSFGDSVYWQISGEGRYYDTAMALMFLDEDSEEETNSISWLEDSQGEDGCWNNGNLRDTAFVLYSVWGGGSFGGGTGGGSGDANSTTNDCESNGYFCTSTYNCEIEAGGNVLSDYTCSGYTGASVCCDTPIGGLQTCSELDGIVCDSNEICKNGEERETSETTSDGSVCCIGGVCDTRTTPGASDCVSNDGVCRSFGCNQDEEESFTYTCNNPSDYCCFDQGGSGGGNNEDGETNYLWIWILGILIILVVLGIVFRDSIRRFFLRFKSGGSSKGRPKRPGYPPAPLMRSGPGPVARRPQRRGPSEMDDVLKKLKEMGK